MFKILLSGKFLVLPTLITIILWLVFNLNNLQGKVKTYQQRAYHAESLVVTLQGKVDDMKARQQSVADLDKKYSMELDNAKKAINELESDVIAGRRRLQLSTKCASTTTSAGMDDACTTRFNHALERNYFTLRERIVLSEKMILGLQQYIAEQCAY
ncbi:lysis protein (plasmid) [Pantoea sp. BJ2]|uniref:Lysis protein n=1 Tax=Pantoea sp. BJ2 TaxID=3141322 RepID=A0AAU7U4K0_9GAMM